MGGGGSRAALSKGGDPGKAAPIAARLTSARHACTRTHPSPLRRPSRTRAPGPAGWATRTMTSLRWAGAACRHGHCLPRAALSVRHAADAAPGLPLVAAAATGTGCVHDAQRAPLWHPTLVPSLQFSWTCLSCWSRTKGTFWWVQGSRGKAPPALPRSAALGLQRALCAAPPRAGNPPPAWLCLCPL